MREAKRKAKAIKTEGGERKIQRKCVKFAGKLSGGGEKGG